MNSIGKDGITALMLAAQWQDPEEVRVLLEAGADPGAKDAEGSTALEFANPAGNEEVLELLRDAAAGKR